MEVWKEGGSEGVGGGCMEDSGGSQGGEVRWCDVGRGEEGQEVRGMAP